jgi:NADPH:quinone reductase-like Zn-dependent oxidoreductase
VYGELSQLIAEGVISAAVQATYPLEDYRKALHEAQAAGRAGKVLFVPTTSALSR